MVRSSDRLTVWVETYCCFICCPGGTFFFRHKHKNKLYLVVFHFETYSLYSKGSRAELGSRPSVEGPMDPTGPTEYTEQTLDADSQVGFFLAIIYLHLIGSKA